MKIKTLLSLLVGFVFCSTLAAVALIALRGGPAAGGLPVLGDVPAFTLTEAGGKPLGRADLEGKVWIASFIFTRCATVCPMMMKQEVRLQQQLPVRDDLRLVTFSVDPAFDTPAVLTAYAAGFGADRQRWWFLTGDQRAIWRLAQEGFQLTTSDAADEEMPILHSSKLVLIDRSGRVRGYYDSAEETALPRLVRDVKRLLAERS